MGEQQIGFTYDPLQLTRLLLQTYAEKRYDRNESYSKSVRLAIYDFLDTMKDDELEDILNEYVTSDNVEYITFKDDADCERITYYIMESDRFKGIVFEYQKKGTSGLGVADLSDKTFYECNFSRHWETVGYILREKYGKYGEAFDEIMYGFNTKEYSGVTSDELDKFIMERFKLVGAYKTIENHLEDRNS
jgi:hypothetical protein